MEYISVSTKGEFIKPCPFCGTVPDVYKEVESKHYHISCLKCHRAKTFDCHTKEEAIEEWNDRKPVNDIVKLFKNEEIKFSKYSTPLIAIETVIDLLNKHL